MIYLVVKQVHYYSVLTSFALFLLRGAVVLSGHALPRNIVLRMLPHAVDTVLLTTALWLTTLIHQFPFVHGWLTVKVVLLVVYVVLGSYALKRAPTRRGKAIAFVLAAATFGYIYSVARAHHPLGIFASLT